MAVGGFSVLVHGETGFAYGIAGRKPGGIFGIPHYTANAGRFLYLWSDFQLEPWLEMRYFTRFAAFCSWLELDNVKR